tara:strand:+ start:213 stop:317 length:105 start_codon:yes stop_codon:yes gene_type:complete
MNRENNQPTEEEIRQWEANFEQEVNEDMEDSYDG